MNKSTETVDQKAGFVVRLVGPGVNPSVVPLRALARILGAVQRLVDQKDDGINEEAEDTKEPEAEGDPSRVLHLLDVKTSSAAYHVGTARHDEVYRVLSTIASSINSPDSSDWLDSTISSIKELSEVSKALGCGIEFCEPKNGEYGSTIASINDETYDRVRNSAFVCGDTSVYARVEDVGGHTARHCHIRLPQFPRKMIVCGVANDDLVRGLGQHLYEYVIVTGRAKWLRHNWRLKRLEITDFTPPKRGSVRDTLNTLRELGGGVWDQIEDPDAYIAEMRRS